MRESEKIEFENFKDNFLFEFVFKAIERPKLDEFLKVHFIAYEILYKNVISIKEYSVIAIKEDIEEFEKLGMQLKIVVKNNPNYFNNCWVPKDLTKPNITMKKQETENKLSFFEWWEYFTELMYKANYEKALDKDFFREHCYSDCGMSPSSAKEWFLNNQ